MEKMNAGKEESLFPNPFEGGLDKLIRMYGYLFAAGYMFKKKKDSQGPVLINMTVAGKHKVGYPSAEC
jgi:hypothetical protein